MNRRFMRALKIEVFHVKLSDFKGEESLYKDDKDFLRVNSRTKSINIYEWAL